MILISAEVSKILSGSSADHRFRLARADIVAKPFFSSAVEATNDAKIKNEKSLDVIHETSTGSRW